MIDVSCILINYNTNTFTLNCVNSILDKTKSNLSYEIIIIDNGSNIDNYISLKKDIKKLNSNKLKLVRSKINSGFGGGNMIGVQNASSCKYYAFINNDTLLLQDDTLLGLMRFMEKQEDAAVCSPQMLDEHKNFKNTIDHFSSLSREILKRSFLEFTNPKRFPNRKIRYQNSIKVDYVQGSFLFIDAHCFNHVGGFDTNLFLYYEESDICRRILKETKKHTYLVSHFEYIHFHGASTDTNISMKIEQKISLFYYIRKHYGWLSLKILQTYFIVRYGFTTLIKPKYWPLFIMLLEGMPISKSLKQNQKIFNE